MYRITTILIMCMLVLPFINEAQNSTFEYSFISNSNDMVYDIAETSNDDIFFCGSIAKASNKYYQSMLFVKLNQYGDLVDSLTLKIDGRSIFAKRLLNNYTNDFIVVSMISDTLVTRNETGLALFNLDTDFNLSNGTIYNFDSIYLFEEVCATILSNNNILASIALRIHPSGPRSYIYEFNSGFDSIDSKYYPDDSRIISHVHELPNNNIWTLNMLLFRYELLDTNYNVIETQKVPHSILSNYGVAWETDTSFYLVGHNTENFSEPYNISYIKQYNPIDTSGHIYNYWRSTDTVDFPAVWNGIDFKNKDSIFIGGTKNIDFYSPWYGYQKSWFVVLQTDSLLNLRWERFYGGDAYYIMTKLIASNDGGCIIAGQRYDYEVATEEEFDIIILKLNNEGLLTTTNEDTVFNMQEAIIYPNPGNGVINLRIGIQHTESLFELFDINGRQIISQRFTSSHGSITTTFLKNGTYIYKITNDNGLFEGGKWIKQ